MDVGEGTEKLYKSAWPCPLRHVRRALVAIGVNELAHLVHVQLDLQHRHGLLELRVVSRRAVHGLGHEFEHQVEVDLVLL